MLFLNSMSKISYSESRKNNTLDGFVVDGNKKQKQISKGENKMTENENVVSESNVVTNNPTWDDAVKSSGFVKIEEDKEKILILTNVKLVKRDDNAKFGASEVEFIADVLEEDGVKVEEKKFNTVSKRMKIKLKPIFENKKLEDKTKISILQVGKEFSVQYSIKELEQ